MKTQEQFNVWVENQLTPFEFHHEILIGENEQHLALEMWEIMKVGTQKFNRRGELKIELPAVGQVTFIIKKGWDRNEEGNWAQKPFYKSCC